MTLSTVKVFLAVTTSVNLFLYIMLLRNKYNSVSHSFFLCSADDKCNLETPQNCVATTHLVK